jgi:hypothetical protein
VLELKYKDREQITLTLRSVPYPFNSIRSALGYNFLIQAADLTACPENCLRPVGLVFGKDDRLYVTSDATGEVCRGAAVS